MFQEEEVRKELQQSKGYFPENDQPLSIPRTENMNLETAGQPPAKQDEASLDNASSDSQSYYDPDAEQVQKVEKTSGNVDNRKMRCQRRRKMTAATAVNGSNVDETNEQRGDLKNEIDGSDESVDDCQEGGSCGGQAADRADLSQDGDELD